MRHGGKDIPEERNPPFIANAGKESEFKKIAKHKQEFSISRSIQSDKKATLNFQQICSYVVNLTMGPPKTKFFNTVDTRDFK